MWTSRPGSVAAIIWVMRRASRSRDAELVPLTTGLADAGRATGRLVKERPTTMAAITRLLPRPVLRGP